MKTRNNSVLKRKCVIVSGTMAEGGNDSASCPVCFEEYSDSGEHVPRIMPCSHTLCHKCIKALLQGGLQIKCPECKKQHQALKGEKSFPQNKYVLENIRLRMKIRKVGHKEKKELCQDHAKKLTFFCKDSCCRKFICRICLIESHKQHDFVNMVEGQQIIQAEQDKKKVLLKEIDKELCVLEKFMANRVETGGQVVKKLENNLGKLIKAKNAIEKKFEERIEKLSSEKHQANFQTQKLTADLDLLKSMRETASQSENIKDVAEALEDVRAKTRERAVNVVFNYTDANGTEMIEMVEQALNRNLIQRRVNVSSAVPLGKLT